jgi:hypothetical protein
MKKLLSRKSVMILSLIGCALSSVSAFAFPQTIELGAGTFIAKKACADLGIAAGDQIFIETDYSHFEMSKASNTDESGFKTLFKYSVPDEGTYVFKGSAGLQYTDEFLTNAFSGQDIYDYKADQSTGDVVVTHNGSTHCLLTNNTGG